MAKLIQKAKAQKNSAVTLFRYGQLVILGVLLLLIPSQNSYAFRMVTETLSVRPVVVPPTPAPLPVNPAHMPPPLVTAEGVVIIDEMSGMSMYEKNPDIQFLPASTTKILSALVVLADYQLSDTVTVKTVETEGQVMGLVQGETMTVENLMYGMLVHSANDAALALAEYHAGGVEGFVTRMNEVARQIHLANSHFTNPIGLDNPNHYTTPRNLARLSIYALQNPLFAKMVGIPTITVADTTYTQFHTLKNVNELLGKIPGVSGIKTGWTELAEQALVTLIQRGGHKVVIVLLKSKDRFGETENLLNWVFANYSWQDMGYVPN